MVDIDKSHEIRLQMQGEDQVLRLESRLLGLERYIREALDVIENLIIALELEADYPGERSREEMMNAKSFLKESIDLGLKKSNI